MNRKNNKLFQLEALTARGFTLIEIMIVVVIIAILASIIVPKIMGRPEQARMVKARTDIISIQNAMELYKLDNSFYPSTSQGIKALVEKPSTDPIPDNWQGYLNSIPKDPWGNEYFYENPGKHDQIDIWSNGPPGKNETIGNWMIK